VEPDGAANRAPEEWLSQPNWAHGLALAVLARLDSEQAERVSNGDGGRGHLLRVGRSGNEHQSLNNDTSNDATSVTLTNIEQGCKVICYKPSPSTTTGVSQTQLMLVAFTVLVGGARRDVLVRGLWGLQVLVGQVQPSPEQQVGDLDANS